MIVTTDDSSTLIRMAREGYIQDVRVVFSFRYWTFLYQIKTNL